jgi:hypothetical protein
VVTVRIDHQKIRHVAIENGPLFVSEFAPAPLLESATFSDRVLALQQAGQSYPNAMQQTAHVMAAEGRIARGIGSAVATARIKRRCMPSRAAWDQVIGHGLLRGEGTPVGPLGRFLNSGF